MFRLFVCALALLAGSVQAEEGAHWVIQSRDAGSASTVSVNYVGEETLKRLEAFADGKVNELRFVRERLPWGTSPKTPAVKAGSGRFEFEVVFPRLEGRVIPGDDALNLWIPPIEDPVIGFFEPEAESRVRYRATDRVLSVTWIVELEYDPSVHRPQIEKLDFKESSFEADFEAGPAESLLTKDDLEGKKLSAQSYALRLKLKSRAWELHAADIRALHDRWTQWLSARFQGGGLSSLPGATKQMPADRWARFDIGLRVGADFPKWQSLGVDTLFGGVSFGLDASVEKRLARWLDVLLVRTEFGLFSGTRWKVATSERAIEGWVSVGPEIQFRVPGLSRPLSSGLSYFFVDLYARPFLQYIFLNDPLIGDFGTWWSVAWSAGFRVGRGDWRPGIILGGPIHLAFGVRVRGPIPGIEIPGRPAPLSIWAGLEVY